MDKLEDFPPISRHVRYALVRNSIVQNGEYQKKLNEIGRDHRRKGRRVKSLQIFMQSNLFMQGEAGSYAGASSYGHF